jgi:anti-sigma-K factor RskA
MTTPIGGNSELLDLAVPYALHALPEAEQRQLEARIAADGAAEEFYDEVRAVRETMAAVSAAAAAAPPSELRGRVLSAVADDGRLLSAVADDTVRTLPSAQPARPRRTAWLSAAAALLIGFGALGVGLSLRPPAPQPSTAQQVFSASDVHTVSGAIPAGGTATVVFSRDRNAGVLVMNDVPPPGPGTVYQMWLVSADGATSAGTMDADAVAPSTTAVLNDLGNSTKLAFTVEPASGSTQPTGALIAELPLT